MTKEKLNKCKNKPGIILEDKYARLIRGRKKREIISTENFYKYIGKEIYLCSNKVYGSIILNGPIKLDRDLLNNHEKRHLITTHDVYKYWPNEKTFYAYSFRITKMFKTPQEYKNTNIKFGIIDNIEFENSIGDSKMNKKDICEKDAAALRSNSRLDKYYNKLNSLLKAVDACGKYEELAVMFLSLYELYLQKGNEKIYDKNGVVLKPAPDITENYIRIRIRDPKTIVEGSFRTINISTRQGIKAVIGKLKKDPEAGTKIQSVLFDKKKWDTKRATAWLASHKEDFKNLDSDGLKEKTKNSLEDSVAGWNIAADKATGKQEEKWIWCEACEDYFDYYKQLIDDKSAVICPHCGALVIFEED